MMKRAVVNGVKGLLIEENVCLKRELKAAQEARRWADNRLGADYEKRDERGKEEMLKVKSNEIYGLKWEREERHKKIGQVQEAQQAQAVELVSKAKKSKRCQQQCQR